MRKIVKINLVCVSNRCLLSDISMQGALCCCADEITMQATSAAVGCMCQHCSTTKTVAKQRTQNEQISNNGGVVQQNVTQVFNLLEKTMKSITSLCSQGQHAYLTTCVPPQTQDDAQQTVEREGAEHSGNFGGASMRPH